MSNFEVCLPDLPNVNSFISENVPWISYNLILKFYTGTCLLDLMRNLLRMRPKSYFIEYVINFYHEISYSV